MFYAHLKGHIEALLFAGGEPLTIGKLASILEIEADHVQLLVDELQTDMQTENRGLAIVEIAGGYQLCTKPELASLVEKIVEIPESKLSMAAIETLSIVAFKQPVTKQEIEAIRGVKIDKLLGTLVERRLLKELGRKDVIGRPILYGTTVEFLKCFGLKNLQDLPPIADFLEDQSE